MSTKAELAAHLDHARRDFAELRAKLFAALNIDPESRPLPSVTEMIDRLIAERSHESE